MGLTRRWPGRTSDLGSCREERRPHGGIPGGLGGLRGLVPLRMLLGNLGITLLPDQIAIPSAFQAFGTDGRLVDPKQEAVVRALGAKLAEQLKKALA